MKIIAYCGLDCSQGKIYQASINDDLEEKRKIIQSWSTDKFPLTMENIECFGCKGDKIVEFCEKCEIRACSIGKKLTSCALCQVFPCQMLHKVFEKNPDAEKILKNLRQNEK